MQRWICAAFAALLLAAHASAQSAGQPNEGLTIAAAGGGAFTLSWWGKAGRTYFLLHSSDLYSWSYFPVIESGSEAIIQWGSSASSPNFFVRLQYTDIPTSNPATDDFNGDGVSNLTEIQNNMSPFIPPPIVTVTSPAWVTLAP
jgi:hypothetical protein